MDRNDHDRARRPKEQRTPEHLHPRRGGELTGRAWEAIERADQHMASSAQRLDRSQVLLDNGAERIRWWLTRRGDGDRAVDDGDR